MAASSYREEIYETFADADRDLDDRIARALGVGTDFLDLPIGFLTRIDGGVQEIVQATGDHEALQPGETCPLDDAYCRRTIEMDSPLAVQDADASGAVSARAVRRFGLSAYVGARILVDDDVYGTVCFAGTDERSTPFSEAEEVFVELLAEQIGRGLERRDYERELRQRNERLTREKRRFEGIAENSFDVLFRLGPDAEFTYVSSAVERVLGYAPEEMIGEQFGEFVDGSSADDALTAYERMLDDDAVEGIELDFRDADGDAVVLAVNATPIDDDGEVVGVQGVGRDVTARKERQRELRLKNRAMDEARVGISIADARRPDDPLVYVNEGFERITGYDADEVMGRNCRFLQGEATDPEPVDRLRERIEAGDPVAVELLNYRRDGTPFWNGLRLSPVADEAGEVTHYLGFQTDVTDRKRIDQLVRLLNRVLRHNLRNDMTAILGFADLLRDDAGGDPATIGERIEGTASGLVDLAETARELERHARRERDPRRLDPATLLGDVADTYRERFPAASVDLRVRTDRGLCAGAELERAVSELVENAVTHNPAPEPRVEVEVGDAGDCVAITVRDDGPGIEEMEATVVSTGRETPLEHGSGLGLWLVNWIVTRYGGSFRVRTGDEGTVATIEVPGLAPDETVEGTVRPPTALFQ